MKLSLIVLSEGKSKGQTIPIKLSQFLIGRDPQCQLRPASPIISKRHCAVIIKDDKVVVRDFNSTNGTFVNEEPVKSEKELKNDDILQVGPISFRVAMEKSVGINKPTPPPSSNKAEGDSETSIAAMLLSLQEGDGSSEVAEEEVPAGTTMMDIPNIPGSMEEEIQAKKEKEKEEQKEKEKEKEKKEELPPKTSAAAAAEILEKYSRRPRR